MDAYFAKRRALYDAWVCDGSGEPVHGVYDTDAMWTCGDGREFTIEHVVPKSLYGSAPGIVDDAHLFYLATRTANSARSNYRFLGDDACEGCALEHVRTEGGLDVLRVVATGELVARPPAVSRGNVARVLFYFAGLHGARYVRWARERFGTPAQRAELLAWHAADPVDDAERRRHEAVVRVENGRRNPFIDDAHAAGALVRAWDDRDRLRAAATGRR